MFLFSFNFYVPEFPFAVEVAGRLKVQTLSFRDFFTFVLPQQTDAKNECLGQYSWCFKFFYRRTFSEISA